LSFYFVCILFPYLLPDPLPSSFYSFSLTLSFNFNLLSQYLGEKLVLRNERIETATLAFREAKLLSGAGLGMSRALELDAVKAPRKGGDEGERGSTTITSGSRIDEEAAKEEDNDDDDASGVAGGASTTSARRDLEAPRVESNPIAASAAGTLEGTF
jgi:hypothetical protein